MKAVSLLKDSRIDALNVLIEIEVGEYAALAKEITSNNKFQRKQIKSSKTVYALLKQDLMRQCVIPPIVLALTSGSGGFHEDSNLEEFEKFLNENKGHLVILDGLQRTYTILDLLSDLEVVKDEDSLRLVRSNKIRVEIYVGLDRLGILYRMLTLNTGQTPMSLRQQIEILYLDYIDTVIEGVELIREADGKTASRLSQYNFKDVVEGFNAYLDRDELPIEKADILENINSLEKLSKENQEAELFEVYLITWNTFVAKVNELCGDHSLSESYLEDNSSPFGKNILQVFKKPQAMSGFGAAVGKMIDFKMIYSFQDVKTAISDLNINDPNELLEEINNTLSWIKDNAKKIGNAQRSYFQFFFRDLFNKESDSYKDLLLSTKSALRKYQSQNM